MSEIIIGSDFEVFVYENHNLIECDLLLPNATKSEPIYYNNHYITHDRKSLECSMPPFIFDGSDPLQFYKKVTNSIKVLDSFIKKINPNYRLVFKDALSLKSNINWKKGYEYNVYNGIDYPKEIIDNTITNGLHIHFSGVNNKEKIIKSLDKSIGYYYKLITPFSKRKEYGKLGDFRDKKYDSLTFGFEYRTLGGVMLKSFNLKVTSFLLNKVLISSIK
jgi:hypothetical protein